MTTKDSNSWHPREVVTLKAKSEVGDELSAKEIEAKEEDEDEDLDGEGTARQSWSRKSEYVLSMIGFSVGLGNIWRFPYVCMRNGGGAFLIPFLVSVLLCAMPMFVFESVLGQYLGKSVWHTWSICPLFKGIGVSMNLLCLFVSWYYCMILAWCAIYLVNSFKSPLPWTMCGQPWNTPACLPSDHWARGSNHSTGNFTPGNLSLSGNSSLPGDLNGWSMSGAGNFSSTSPQSILSPNLSPLGASTENGSAGETIMVNFTVTSANEFWLHNVLELSSGLHDMGGFPWHTVVALVVVNILVLLTIINGVRTSGKVVYVTATLPYLLLIILLIAAITQPGSEDGIIFYIKPDFSKLVHINTWVEAFIQVFYSLGVGIGSMITMASYNKFHNNCVRDSILLSLCCEGTSVFGGFAVFAVLGHMAFKSNIPIENFAKSGAGLAFIVYPDAISYLPLPQLWGVLFFLMLLTLGFDSQFVNIETILTTLSDISPRFTSRWRKTISICALVFITLIALVFASRGGMYLFQLVDWYYAAFTYLIQGALECIIVAWIYGADRFNQDIEMMIGKKVSRAMIICWKFVTPTLLMVMFFTTLISYDPPVYEGYTYSNTAVAFGWLFAVFPFLTIVLWFAYELLSRQGSLAQRLRDSCQPSPAWVPNCPSKRSDKLLSSAKHDDYII